MQTKNIALSVFLTLITCGIYGLYWLYVIASSFEKENLNSDLSVSPGLFVFISIITCGVFTLFAYYKWGVLAPELLKKYNIPCDSNRVLLYLFLFLFGFSIIILCIIQDDFNKIYSIKPPSLPSKNMANSGSYEQNPPPASYR